MKALCALMPFPPLFNAKLSVVAISRASFDTRKELSEIDGMSHEI